MGIGFKVKSLDGDRARRAEGEDRDVDVRKGDEQGCGKRHRKCAGFVPLQRATAQTLLSEGLGEKLESMPTYDAHTCM
eukprot:365661-Chlamydomonas_euryale.AAC.66